MRLSIGQPDSLWQNGTPQSMQRAPCVRSCSVGRRGEDFQEILHPLQRIAVRHRLPFEFFEACGFTHRAACSQMTDAKRQDRNQTQPLVNGDEFAFGRVAIAFPPLEPANQFFHLEIQLRQLQCPFGRRIAADAVAIRDIEFAAIEMLR